MKKIGKLKLNQLSKAELEKHEMKNVLGGTPSGCQCGCGGPSSVGDNCSANGSYGYTETYGTPQCCSCGPKYASATSWV